MDFTIIIPAKNEEKNITQCLSSIAAIDYPQESYEVIVVDNGSTDGTVAVAKSFHAQVHVKPGLTISGLRNFAAQVARGKVLAFIDADCTVFPDWLSTAAAWINSTDIACYGAPPEIPAEATWVQKSWFLVRGKKTDIEDVQWLESMNMFIPRDTFLSVQGFDESLVTCEDYDLSIRLQSLGRIVSDRRIRAIHHGEAATIGHFFRKECWRGISNLKGLRKHGFHARELPSLILPVVYLLCGLLSFLYLLLLVVGVLTSWSGLFLWLLLWQGALLVLALRKAGSDAGLYSKLGLYLLINIYFTARARAMFRLTE